MSENFKMPVKYSMLDDFLSEMSFLSDSCSAAELIFPEIWDKFQLEDLDDSFSDDFDLIDCSSQPMILNLDHWGEIRNHDCMWAGHCGSIEHPSDVRPIKPNILNTFTKPITQNAGRSLLLKTQIQPTQQQPFITTPLSNVLNTMESPPNSDDEEAKCKTETLKILQEAISECDDNDLYDYFEDDDFLNDTVEEEEDVIVIKPVENTPASTSSAPAKSPQVAQFNSDHCYHKDKNATMHINLGIETPSDSEEEIDVVTISEKQSLLTPSTRMPCLLPNNPTTRDRQQIQRTMASAINNFGVRTLLPRGKPALIPPPEVDSPPKRSLSTDHRGVKRQRRRSSPTSSPYKKRQAYKSCNQSSDSEQEPSEKRSMHNNMERQRRIDLRNAFEDLKTMVPEVKKRDRAPKVVILREASVYCRKLENISYQMVDEIDDLKRKQKQLRARVSQLRLSLAHKHR